MRDLRRFLRLRRPRWRPRRGIRWRAVFGRLRPHTRRTAGVVAVALLAVLWLTHGRADAAVDTWSREDILAAIRFVESSDRDDVPDGDDGLAIGPFQIHRVYWEDAVAFEPGLAGTYQDCRRRDYAERVVAAYMRRYAPTAWEIGDGETIARVHNGGPTGASKRATLGYVRPVRERLPPPQ